MENSGQPVQPSPPMPMQLMNVPCHTEVHSESNVPDHLWDWWNDDQQRQWLQVQPWNNSDPWNQYGIVASRTGRQQNQSWDQWNRWNAGGWNQWSPWSAGGNGDEWWSSRSQSHSEPKKYFDKSPPPEWDGNHPEKTWRDYRRTVSQWLSTTDVPSEKHGMLLLRALTGDAKLLISHFCDEDLLHWDAGQRIFEVLAQAHKHISEFEDQDDFDNAFYKLHRKRNQTLLQFANVARAAYLKHDAYGYPLPDRTKSMIFLRQAKIPAHLEDHIMAKTNGSRNFSDLLDAIQILARRPTSQISSSFPSYYDEWDDKCGELGHLAKECPQNKETTTNSKNFFSGVVYINSCDVHPSILETGFGLIVAVTILVQVLFEAIVLVFLKTILLVFLEVILLVLLEMTVLVFLEVILVHVTLETNPVQLMTLETNPRCTLILETVGVLKLIFNKMMKLFSMFVLMM